MILTIAHLEEQLALLKTGYGYSITFPLYLWRIDNTTYCFWPWEVVEQTVYHGVRAELPATSSTFADLVAHIARLAKSGILVERPLGRVQEIASIIPLAQLEPETVTLDISLHMTVREGEDAMEQVFISLSIALTTSTQCVAEVSAPREGLIVENLYVEAITKLSEALQA